MSRPVGPSSRVRRAPTTTAAWRAANGEVVDLPVVVDYVVTESDGSESVRIEVTVSKRGGWPTMTGAEFSCEDGLDPGLLEREFRWRTPLDIVERLMPRLMSQGVDPYDMDLPTSGYPEAASGALVGRPALSEHFLRARAEDYLRLGRGYSRLMAAEFGVSPRTAASWIAKARKAGIISAPSGPGRVGGELVPPTTRSGRT